MHIFAFDDNFVWYLAGRLASDRDGLLKLSGVKLEPDLQAQLRGDWTLLYHRALIDCKGGCHG
jgi:hypothetical protein